MLLLTLMVYSSTMVPVRLTVIMECSRTECRVNLAYSIMTSLSWIWDAEWVSVLNMVRIYRALVSAVLLYAVETWGLTQLTVIDVQSLETAHQKCLETDTRDTLVRSYHQQRILITHRPGHCLTLPVCTTYCPLWTCCPTGQVHRGRRHTWLFNVTLTYHSTDFQIIHGVVARVILHQVVRSTFGTPPTMHSEIYGGVVFAMVVVKWRNGPRQLCDSDEDDGKLQYTSCTQLSVCFCRWLEVVWYFLLKPFWLFQQRQSYYRHHICIFPFLLELMPLHATLCCR